MGGPGSGKTTVGRSISSTHGIPYISSGDIARELAEADPTTALSLKAGSMAPEDSMRALVKGKLERAVAHSGGFVVEGFPRTVAQFIALRMWGFMPVYLWMKIGTSECLERLVSRARADDTPDAIAKRLATFQNETIPIFNLLSESEQVQIIYANSDEETVKIQAEQAIEDFF
jgi:adenylate kinase